MCAPTTNFGVLLLATSIRRPPKPPKKFISYLCIFPSSSYTQPNVFHIQYVFGKMRFFLSHKTQHSSKQQFYTAVEERIGKKENFPSRDFLWRKTVIVLFPKKSPNTYRGKSNSPTQPQMGGENVLAKKKLNTFLILFLSIEFNTFFPHKH